MKFLPGTPEVLRSYAMAPIEFLTHVEGYSGHHSGSMMGMSNETTTEQENNE